MNNWSELIKFKHYFKSKSEHLIEQCKQTAFAKEGHDIENHNLKFELKTPNIGLYSSHYFTIYNNRKIKVTKRELDCLKGLAQGRSHKDIGKMLGISYRTIEHHQKTLLHKFYIDTKSQLLDIYHLSELRFL